MSGHPSGRPIHRRIVVGRQMWRIPDDGPVIPRLREARKNLSVVGFHRQFVEAEPEGPQARLAAPPRKP